MQTVEITLVTSHTLLLTSKYPYQLKENLRRLEELKRQNLVKSHRVVGSN